MKVENRISLELSEVQKGNIQTAIDSIASETAGLISLTKEDKLGLAKMGDKSVAFVNKCLEIAHQKPEIVPAYIDIEEFKKDVSLINDLTSLLFPLQELLEKLEDTTTLAGSEAFVAALSIYAAIRNASGIGVPGMKSYYEELKMRFPGRRSASYGG